MTSALVDELHVRFALKQACGDTDESKRTFADSICVPIKQLDLILSGAALPTTSVLRALGYERVTRYVKKPEMRRETT